MRLGLIGCGFHFMDSSRMLFGEVDHVYSELRGFRPEGVNTVREGRENTAVVTFTIELHDFFEAVRTGGQPEVNGEEGLKTLALPLAVYESGYSGQAVQVADILSGSAHAYQDEIDAHWPV